MRTQVLVITAALIGAAGVALAQTAPNTNPGQPPGAMPGMARDAQPGRMGMPGPHHEHAMGDRHHHRGPGRSGLMGLVHPADDRNLSQEDVRKIAEAFLLWHGNRSWKVVDVGQNADKAVAFAFATAEGSVIARFTMDPKTGRVTRQG